MRPRLSPEHAQAINLAAALAELTPNQYLQLVIFPLVTADLRQRAASNPTLIKTLIPDEHIIEGEEQA